MGKTLKDAVRVYVSVDKDLEIAGYLCEKKRKKRLNEDELFVWEYITNTLHSSDPDINDIAINEAQKERLREQRRMRDEEDRRRWESFRATFKYSDKTDEERIRDIYSRYHRFIKQHNEFKKFHRLYEISYGEGWYVIPYIREQLPGFLTQLFSKGAALGAAEGVIEEVCPFLRELGYPMEEIRRICSKALPKSLQEALRVLDSR